MLDDLRAFVAVVDKASVTAAANALSLTQSAVSRRIQQLESSLGATLLDRTSKPASTTAVGQRVYQAALPLLRSAQQLASIAAETSSPTGTFMLGLTQVVADIALFDAVKQMKSRFPALDLRCVTDWSSAVERQLVEGKLDAATLMLVAGATPPSGVQAKRIATIDVMVVQGKRRPLVGKRASIDEIAGQEWVLNPLGCGYRAALQRAMEAAGKPVRLGVDTQGTELQLSLVAAGFGLGLAPAALLGASAHANELTVVRVPGFSLSLDIWLAYGFEVGNLRAAMDVLEEVLVRTFANRKPGSRSKSLDCNSILGNGQAGRIHGTVNK